MTRERNYKLIIIVLITLLLLIVAFIGGRGVFPAFADTYGNTNVLQDLQKDSSFDINDYPDNSTDYSVNVIQIAESVKGDLYLYTYQPCQKTRYLIATDINMSLSESADGTRLYDLTLVNTSGVFGKYLVKDIKVNSDKVRYYNITSIYRLWDKEIDGSSGNDNIKNEKYFAVGKCFKAETVDGSVKYSCSGVDTIEIKNPYVDFLSYGQQSNWDYIFGVTKWTDIHYVALSTNKKIDLLKQADVTYITQSYHYTGKNNEGYTYGEKSEPQYITLTGKEEIGIDGNEKYTWKSIYRTEDFIETTELMGTAKAEVEKSEFVLVFLKTPFDEQEKWSMMQGHYKEADGVKVSDVSILRLMFETDGKVYNLGALMDKQEGDDIAGNKPENEDIGFWAYIWRCIVRLFDGTATLTEQIVAIVVLAICILALPILLTVLSLCIPAFGAVMKTIFKAIWTGIKYLFIGLWYIISAPFRFIAWIVRKCRGEQ